MPRGVEHVNEEETVGCLDIFFGLMKACGLFCYVACPPVPSSITRKLAFHPPQKNSTYRIALKNDPAKIVKNISEVKNEEYQIVIRNLANNQDYIPTKEDVEVFCVTTEKKNDLVCVRCSPFEPSSNRALSEQIILFCQPNSSDLGGFLQPSLMNLMNYSNVFEMEVFSFDYSGYGYSSGSQGEKNVYADVRAVYQAVREMRPDKKIVLMGYSIGTTAVIDLAATNPEGLSGVVLIAPFTSGLRLVSSKPAKPNTCWADAFTSYDKIGNIETKVLICHGDSDEVIPLEHGMALYEKLRNPVPPSVIHGANHQTILSGRHLETFFRISRFLKTETQVGSRLSEISSPSNSKNSRSRQTI